jgi:transcriptional regulator with PAS, ATPase and Fis domain
MANVIEPVDYEEFEQLHVVRRLKQIIGNWWKLQVNFTDERGYLRGVPAGKFFNPQNPVSEALVADDATFKDSLNFARLTTQQNLTAKGPRYLTADTGFSAVSVPLRADGRYLGCIFADGFIFNETTKEQRKKLEDYINQNYTGDKASLIEKISDIPVLSKKDVEFLTELMQVVMEEIVTVRKRVADTDEKLEAMSKELSERWDFGKMVGKSGPMITLFKLLTRVCQSDATILVTGENGTGKEGIARAIHYNSNRKKQNFVVQNCGALNDNLLESELFGHVKGSFTSAMRDKKGLFELADNGTLFLDEIGDTSPAMQVKLLRVLQEGTFIPVGGSEQRKVNVRVLAATNKNLEQMVKDGTFREDLYYRLNVINVKVPTLRDRKEDIPLLLQRFLEMNAMSSGTPIKKVTREVLDRLERYNWPGNVRELQNEVERLCVLAGSEREIGADLLSERIAGSSHKDEKYPGLRTDGKLKDAIEDLERRMIYEGLVRESWNKSRVAKKLGISRAGLIMKCEKFGFDREDDYEEPSAS